MHVLSSFFTRHIDSLSLALQKYLLRGYHSGLQQLFSVLVRSLLLYYQSKNYRTATQAQQYCLWRNKQHSFYVITMDDLIKNFSNRMYI